jgi:hypothetical protein
VPSRPSPRPAGRRRRPGAPAGRALRFGRLPSQSERRLIAAAFHEAGHAVAAHVRVRFRQIVIGQNTAKERMLELWLTPQAPDSSVVDVRTEHAIERSVIVLLAGSRPNGWRSAELRGADSTSSRPSVTQALSVARDVN